MRILIVEDEKPISKLIEMSLTSAGYACTCVYDGMAAADLLEEHRYDLVLLDVRMPRMGGRETAGAIRGLEREDAERTLIFALSADAFPEDKKLSLESGMDGHFAKPVDFEHMQAEIGKLLSEREKNQKRHEESFSA